MSEVERFVEILTAPGNVLLEGNQASVRFLSTQASDLIVTEHGEATGTARVWRLPGTPIRSAPSVVVFPTGHLAFYGTHGRRILGTDPDGTALHECEWSCDGDGSVQMTLARIQLDCQQWVGIRPEATEQITTLNIAPHSQGETLSPEALREMAAQAWGVPLDDLRYFYPDESFSRDEQGRVLVRIKKDGLYLLEDGTFRRARFVSYMGAIPWARIDLLNVVELYQSTVPGTGGAAFDLIWGLCDDQRVAEGSIPLRYRGVPAFPSDQAYGLFCAFFRPTARNGEDPYKLFMETQRAHHIAWWPRTDPPWRYFDRARRLCITVQNGRAQKVTLIDDPVAVPYVNIGMKGFAPCERTVGVVGRTMVLRDRDQTTEIPVNPAWGISQETPQTDRLTMYPFGWKAFFRGDPPQIDPIRAWTTALVFPEDESEVGEEATQLFVLEQIYEYLNQLPGLRSRLERTRWVLIHDFDAVCAGFVDPDNRPRRYTILYRRPEWAQKGAQVLWDRAAREGRLEAVRLVEFIPEHVHQVSAYQQKYELIYRWISYADYENPMACEAVVRDVAHALAPMGLGVVVGPPSLVSLLPIEDIRVHFHGGPEDFSRLPAVLEHLRIHSNTRLNPRLTVVLGEKGDLSCLRAGRKECYEGKMRGEPHGN